jgi:hypothetical protein
MDRGIMKKQLAVLLTIVLVGILGLLSLPIGGVEVTTSGGHLSISTNVAYASPDVLNSSPTTNTTGAWTNATGAYTDGGTYANITSGTPSGNTTWGTYGFNLTGDTITQVRVRYDAWSAGVTPTVSNNPTANTNGTNPWTLPAQGYTSNNLYATATTTTTLSNNPTANTNGTNPWTNPANGYTSNNAYATAVSTIPAYRATGAMNHSTTSAISPALPSGMSANDIVILVACCYTGGTLAITTNGSITTWNALAGTPVDVASGDKLYVWWGRWSSGSTAPTITPTSGDHIVGRTVAFYNCYAGGDVIDVVATGTEATSDTSYSFATGLTTTYNNELCVSICTTTYDPTSDSTAAFGTMTNANLASISERMDNDVNEGNGGGFGLDHGTLIANGAMGTWNSTLAYASPKSYIAFALKSTNPGNVFDQIYGTFAITGSTTISKVEIGYEAFATATQKLNFYDSVDNGGTWSSAHLTASLATSDPGTYTYIDITSDQGGGWTWTLLNDTNFKIKVITSWVNGTPTWSVDALIVRVTFTAPIYDQIYGTFGFSGTTTITKVEIGYEAFATATQKLDIYDSVNGGGAWSSVHTTGNLVTSDPNAYTYIDVTSDASWTWTLLNDSNFKVKVITNWVSGTPTWSIDALVVRVTYTGANDEQIRVDVTWDGGTSWSSKQTTNLNGTETTYWVDVTSNTTWTPTKLSDANFQVRVDAMTVGADPGDVRLDWIPVEVTYSVNVAPTVGTIAISPSTMTPQEQWTNITVPVTDGNTLADVNQVNVTVFYDSAGNDPSAPGTANVQTCAILTWTRGGSPVWSLAPANTTWQINTGGCSNASDSLTTGNWVFSFKVGKVATHSPGSDNWDIYAKATDSISQTGYNYLRDVEMNWYGEITVGTSTVSWGTVSPGCSNNISPVVNITYICNGNYSEQVKTSQNWTSASDNVTLNTTGSPGTGEFSLKADDDDTIADAVQVLSASYTTFDTGTQTTESGNVENNNHLWLSLGSGIRVDTYSGTIYFGIAP